MLLKTNALGQINMSSFIDITKKVPQKNNSSSFNGTISYHTLQGLKTNSVLIINGYLQKAPISTINSTGNLKMTEQVIDGGDLPGVIVYSSANYDCGTWFNLICILNAGSGIYFNNFNYYTPDIPGSASSGGNAVQIDFELPELKTAIDLQKYINCFGSTQELNATYTITIATDIPVDSDPSKLFNWSDASPGHSYIEFYKNGTNGLIQQDIGFYPNTSWKTATGGDIASKIIDDGGHEYNARYTLSVTASQFQSALNCAKTYGSHSYNISSFNCTDFALAIFNAAGGNLSIPKYQIPGYPNALTGSNTPQGLYNKLVNMALSGTQNIQTTGNKAFGGYSHGPCN